MNTDDVLKIGKFRGATYIVTSALVDASARQEHRLRYIVINNERYYWNNVISISVDFKVISIETSEVIFSKVLRREYTRETSRKISSNGMLSMIPKAMEKIFEELKPKMQNVFPIESLLLAMRGNKTVGMIGVGKQHNITPGRIFTIYKKVRQRTALGTQSIRLAIGELEIFRVGRNTSWGQISGKKRQIKLGMEVQSQSR